MHTRLLSDREREILENFVKSDLKLNGFSVLMLRVRKAISQVREDLELIDKALEKTS